MSLYKLRTFKNSQQIPAKLLEQANKFYFGNVQVKTTRSLFKNPPFKVEMKLNKQWKYYNVDGYYIDWGVKMRAVCFGGEVLI